MGLHSPFDALLRTEKSPPTSQPLRWMSTSPMLSPANWHLPAVIHGSETNPDFTLFPSLSLAKTLESFSHRQ